MKKDLTELAVRVVSKLVIYRANITPRALIPLILLSTSYFFFHDKAGWHAIFGTVLAIKGVAILFLA